MNVKYKMEYKNEALRYRIVKLVYTQTQEIKYNLSH